MGIGNGSELLDSFGDAVKRGIPLDSLVNEGITNVGVDTTHRLVIAKSRLQAHQRRGHSLVSEGLTNDELHAEYFMDDCCKNVDVLRQNGLDPILVFDGNATPLKTKIMELRRAIREENKKKNKNTSKKKHPADSAFSARNIQSYKWPVQRYIPDRSNVCKWLIKKGIQFFVAPYEADAQLTHLASKKIIDAIITIDSDLIAFGCGKRLKEAKDAYKNFTPHKLLEMSIIIGCDYLPNLAGIGIAKAPEKVAKADYKQ
ncbi:PREDICTED: exonuclease 1-like [Fragaria vesca subsp. vesca]|uniref:exonuclease 1-like n=1 Tax=Fragaria vesca subsp. vesca TaxID=101020 RepID=UPI0002C3731F|nr:PREDICTED: exonuclease 1-like [Fragaria vesca subsp. vesca]